MKGFDYVLPPELIAQSGAQPRDASRLMVIDRATTQFEHRIFKDLTSYLKPGDLLVLNQSKVIPARLMATNAQGTPLEVLLIRELSPQVWEALLKPAKRAKGRLSFGENLEAQVQEIQEDGTRVLHFSQPVWPHLKTLGQTPLPPYIQAPIDPQRYQTVYAKTPGSVAAPTAGLHFTPELLQTLQAQGVEVGYITLHVGPGTFKPVTNLEQHIMHLESYFIPPETALLVNRAKAEGRRVVAVGTTVVRTLETAWDGQLTPGPGETKLFIRPGFTYSVVDAMVTNFHLPKSTLLMLVGAFMGEDLLDSSYQKAVEAGYRFYSLGDAMFVF
jgi:S-adenosylmethionine:tRNA ribosyltransferase-isomerase